MPSIKHYEPGMRIIYDLRSRIATVIFRGQVTKLNGLFNSELEACAAGEAYCRRRGWAGPVPPQAPRSLLPKGSGLFPWQRPL